MALNVFASKYKKRERTQNWAYEEKKFLLELCKKDMHIIENKRLDSALTSLKNRAWKLIHQQFAQTFGTERNCNRLKEQWRRMKACSRAEVMDYQHRLSKFGQEVADKKKPNTFTFEIWEFMQEAKKVCKNELMDEMDYSNMKLSLEENAPEGEIPSEDGNDSDDSNTSSNWAPSSQNVCEVQFNEDVSDNTPLTTKRRRTTYSANASTDLSQFYRNPATNSGVSTTRNNDLLNFFRNQYLASNFLESITRNTVDHRGEDVSSTLPNFNESHNNDDSQEKERSMRLQILQIELETAKLNREVAEINKQIAMKRLNKETGL